jgi:hypothetical protein
MNGRCPHRVARAVDRDLRRSPAAFRFTDGREAMDQIFIAGIQDHHSIGRGGDTFRVLLVVAPKMRQSCLLQVVQ